MLVVHSGDWAQIERKNHLHEMCPSYASGESDAGREQKKTFLREVYRRVQAGVGCRLSVKKILRGTCM